VRELQNLINRYISLKKIDFAHEMPGAWGPDMDIDEKADIGFSDKQIDLPGSVAILEKRMIKDALAKSQWHRGKAAKLLNIDRKTLYQKMKKYEIAPSY
jgi:DNA-binding NtrC family response regulator